MWRKHKCIDNVVVLGQTKTPRYECSLCKCLMEKAFKTIKGPHSSDESVYCGKCAPAYDEVRYVPEQDVGGNGYMGHGYFKMARCNYDGTPWVNPWEHLKNAPKSK